MACWSSDGVLAWPAGRPREYQHSLLVVPAQRASRAHLASAIKLTLTMGVIVVCAHTRVCNSTQLLPRASKPKICSLPGQFALALKSTRNTKHGLSKV